MYFLTKELYFPPIEMASPEGIIAVGGDLSPERLLLAYKSGIFPWFEDENPFCGGVRQNAWFCFLKI